MYTPAQNITQVADLTPAELEQLVQALGSNVASILWVEVAPEFPPLDACQLWYVPQGVSADLVLLGVAPTIEAATALVKSTLGVHVKGSKPTSWNRPGSNMHPATKLTITAS